MPEETLPVSVETTILTGELEDHEGRKLYPKTRASCVACNDGQSVEINQNGGGVYYNVV